MSIPTSVRVPHFEGQGRIGTTEHSVPEVGAGQLLLEVRANALCGSERGQFLHGSQVTPGHEAAGRVVAAGQGTSTPLGTAGVVFLMDFCGACRSCRLGATNQCLARRADMGFNRDGGYGRFELVSENIFFPIPAEIPFAEATLLLDIMGTGGHALKRAQRVRGDIESVLIAGAGPIGLGVLAMAKLLLGRDVPVVISDVVPYRLELAQRLGGLPIQATTTSLPEGLKRHGWEAPDVAFDCTGVGAVRGECFDSLAPRGVLMCIAHGQGMHIEEVSSRFIPRELAVLASEYFAFDELFANLELLQANRAYLSQIITHRLGVDDLQHGFELFFGGQTGKVVIEQGK